MLLVTYNDVHNRVLLNSDLICGQQFTITLGCRKPLFDVTNNHNLHPNVKLQNICSPVRRV